MLNGWWSGDDTNTYNKVEIGEDYKGDTDKMFWGSSAIRVGGGKGRGVSMEEACEIGLHGWIRFIRVTFFSSLLCHILPFANLLTLA